MASREFTPAVEVRKERTAEVERVATHIEMSLTELISKEDSTIGRWEDEAERGVEGAAGNLKQAEDRHSLLIERRQNRRREMEQQRSLTLQAVDRLTSIIILPHPDRDRPDMANLRPDPETEAIAMRVAIEYEERLGRVVQDVHEKNLGSTSQASTRTPANSGSLRSKVSGPTLALSASRQMKSGLRRTGQIAIGFTSFPTARAKSRG
jgi:hypothetical protein